MGFQNSFYTTTKRTSLKKKSNNIFLHSTLSSSSSWNSPLWGVFWERLIQIVKQCLWEVLKNKPTFEEMSTAITEIQGILNTRPLRYIDENSTDTIITPPHLVFGRILLTKIPNETDLKVNDYSKRFNHIQTLITHFCKSWTFKYLDLNKSFVDSSKKYGLRKNLLNFTTCPFL